jgi:hypothetical protein
MEGLLPLLVVAVFFANLPALKEQWRTDRAGSIKTIRMFVVYIVFCLGAAGLLIWLAARKRP